MEFLHLKLLFQLLLFLEFVDAVDINFDSSWFKNSGVKSHSVSERCSQVSGSLFCVTQNNVDRSLDAGGSYVVQVSLAELTPYFQ
jgi:hypothetical protein